MDDDLAFTVYGMAYENKEMLMFLSDFSYCIVYVDISRPQPEAEINIF